ncbi:MAG TPA: hypothetical protein VHA37_06320 [Candidatus Saccharimonadales bacterium]|nr:hypothetical protein [Candidatus Saccharimonadales bacterium]
MTRSLAALAGGLLLAAAPGLGAQALTAPKTVQAGTAFSLQSGGSGQATLYIVGMGGVFKRDVQGSDIAIPEDTLVRAGHYIAFLSTAPNDVVSIEVTPAKVANISFFARPSRLPVGLRNGITGAVYLFDSYRNLVTRPTPVDFELSTNTAPEKRTVQAKNGSAWVALDSSPKEAAARFIAKAGNVSETRIIQQVPGEPCSIKVSAKPNGNKISLETEPVKDCGGNPVPDGTIVTFTENYHGMQSVVDVPLKKGVAKVDMPAVPGANISVASGVVLGNEIHWGR